MIAASAFTGDASGQEQDATALLDRMSEEIARLEDFTLSGDAYADALLPAGQMIQHSSQLTLSVSKPGAMRLENRNAENTKEIFFSGGTFTVFSATENFFAQTNIAEGIESARDYALYEVGIDAPLLEFVAQDVGAYLLEDAESIEYLDTSLIRGEIFHHVAIRSPELDLQIWIASAPSVFSHKSVRITDS